MAEVGVLVQPALDLGDIVAWCRALRHVQDEERPPAGAVGLGRRDHARRVRVGQVRDVGQAEDVEDVDVLEGVDPGSRDGAADERGRVRRTAVCPGRQRPAGQHLGSRRRAAERVGLDVGAVDIDVRGQRPAERDEVTGPGRPDPEELVRTVAHGRDRQVLERRVRGADPRLEEIRELEDGGVVGRAQRERATHVGAVHHDLQRLRRREAVGPCVGDRRRCRGPGHGRARRRAVRQPCELHQLRRRVDHVLGEAGRGRIERQVPVGLRHEGPVLPVDLTDRQVEQVGGRGFVVDVEPDVVAPDALAVCVGAQDGGTAADLVLHRDRGAHGRTGGHADHPGLAAAVREELADGVAGLARRDEWPEVPLEVRDAKDLDRVVELAAAE